MAPISGVSRKMTMVYRYLDCLVSVFTFRTNGGNTSFGFELLSHNLDSIAVSLFVRQQCYLSQTDSITTVSGISSKMMMV